MAASPAPWTELARLRCPYCYGALALDREMALDGLACAIVACPCGRFPVVEGVLVLDRKPGEWFAGNPSLLRLVEAGDAAAVERYLLEQHQIPRAVLRGSCASFFDALDEAQRVGVTEARTEWLLHMRYWHRTPKYLALMRLVERIAAAGAAPRTLLDFGAGAGHVAHVLASYLRPERVLAVDGSLLFLLLGRWLAEGTCPVMRICCDGTLPLPVVDGACDAIASADAIHYMVAKASVLGELARVAAPDATVCLTHLHNARSPDEPYLGFALEPAVWRALFARAFGGGGALIEDDRLRNGALDDAGDASTTRSFTYLRCGAPRPGAPEPLARPFDGAIVNPTYTVIREGDALALARRVLSRSYESEFVDGQAPATARITCADLANPQARAGLRRAGVVIDPPPRLLRDSDVVTQLLA